VLIGGDYLGKGKVPNAAFTFVGEDVNINADGIGNGNGGKVIVWADQATRAYGTITARGGDEGGNGGFIETSGKVYLDVTKAADAVPPMVFLVPGCSILVTFALWQVEPLEASSIEGSLLIFSLQLLMRQR
jgi:hypothetical protein